jgi:PAS domain S-box-containing protein
MDTESTEKSHIDLPVGANCGSADAQSVSDAQSFMQSFLNTLAGTQVSRSSSSEREITSQPPGKTSRMVEARYRTLVELLPAVTFMATFEEGLSEVYVSPQIESILGYTQREWVENPVLWYQRLHPGDRDRWNLEFARTVAAGDPLQSAYRFLAKSGQIVWIHSQARIVRDDQGRPSFIHGIGVDITQVKEAEQRVLDYTQKLEQTNKELEQFADVASHDLQEPLRSILSYSLIIAEEYRGRLDPQTDQYFERIIESGKRMKGLIQALLEFSRLGRTDLPQKPTDLTSAAHEAVGNLSDAIQENGAHVTVEPLPTLMTIRTYIVMLFQNLIGNAIKYRSKEPPEIHISAVRSNDVWTFSVRDNGLGIDPHHHERIFEIFKRLHTQRDYPGMGIGLPMCRKILELHGGKIRVESEPKKGSSFKFTLGEQKDNGAR